MALPAKLAKEAWEKLNPVLKAEYHEVDGVYRPIIEASDDGWGFENVAGLKTTANERKQRHDEVRRKLDAYKDATGQEISPERARELVEKISKLGDMTDQEKIQARIKAEKDSLEEKHKGERSTWDTDRGSLVSQISELMVDGEVAKILSKPEIKGSFVLLIGKVREHAKVERDDKGKFRLRIIDPRTGASIPTAKSGSSEDMGLEEFILSLRKNPEFAPAFAGTGSTGSGASGTGRNGGQRPNIDPKLSPENRLKLLRRSS
jgi:hypothetical protein